MKLPTLEEVKSHFENAKEVRCVHNGKIWDLTGPLRQGIHSWNGGFWVDLINNNGKLWDKEKGYAEIISYKKKPLSITPEQLRKLTDPNIDLRRTLEEWYTGYDGVFLIPGKYYTDGKGWFCFNGKYDRVLINDPCGFGVNDEGIYRELTAWGFEKSELREMSESEVFEALKIEAVKRGFIKGAYFKGMINGDIERIKNNIYGIIPDSEKWKDKGQTIFEVGDLDIFNNGKWAEVIQVKTKSEAEKLLNCKIVD